MEKSKRSLTVRMTHEDDYGVNEDSNLSHSVRASNKEDSQRTTTLTDNRKERLRKRSFNAWRLMHWHQLRLTCSPSVSGHFTHCWVSLCTSCRPFICYRCTDLFNFWFVHEFLVEIHIAKTGLLRCCLYTPRRLQQTAVSCKRSNCNKMENNKINSWKPLVWGFVQRRQTRVFTVLSCRFACILIYRLSLNYHELHQEPLHYHQAEEELDDWCRSWYF